MNAAIMSLELHERVIHVVSIGEAGRRGEKQGSQQWVETHRRQEHQPGGGMLAACPGKGGIPDLMDGAGAPEAR
jgi:hypothetical protein